MLKMSKGVWTCGLKQQIGGETQEQSELFRSVRALSRVEWTGAGDKVGGKEKNVVVTHKATLGLVSKH